MKSQIGVFVLDTTTGKPAEGVPVRLLQPNGEGSWACLAEDVTNAEGTVEALLPVGEVLAPGNYRLVYETGPYFQARQVRSLYPRVSVDFTVDSAARYVLPLLLSPQGYTTYRGS